MSEDLGWRVQFINRGVHTRHNEEENTSRFRILLDVAILPSPRQLLALRGGSRDRSVSSIIAIGADALAPGL